MKDTTRKKLADWGPVCIALALIIILLLLPTGFEDAVIYKGTDRTVAKVLSVNDSAIVDTGLVRSGEQQCRILLTGGKFKNQEVDAANMLNGSLESDKIYEPGDRVLVVIDYQEDRLLSVTMIDHYRLDKSLILAIAFAAALILFARKTGLRSLFSILLTVLMLWKVLVPAYLRGYNPVWVGLGVVTVLTILIISLVYGFNRCALAAVTGAVAGLIVTAILGAVCTSAFQIHGAIMPNSESLLYSGYQQLNLTSIFIASVFIGASGAVMDVAVDITSAVKEVTEKRPDIGWKEAMRSGINVGRAAMGTMSTTLLLAYSGGYLALLMVFMAQGTPLANILNYKYVSAEIIDTLVGSFGLLSVAPLTAITSGLLLAGKHSLSKKRGEKDSTGKAD